MKLPSFYADLHVHPQLKPFNSGHPEPAKNIWEDLQHDTPTKPLSKLVNNFSKDMIRYSQCNFELMAKSNTKVFSTSLYPFERGWLKHKKRSKLLTQAEARFESIALISGMSPKKIKYFSKSNDYFSDLQSEYEYMKNQQGKSPDGKYSFTISKNFKDVQKTLKTDHEITTILSAEGAHVFFNEKMLHPKAKHHEIEKELIKNIEIVKSWEYPLFFITQAHHFWNGLMGHARSFDGVVQMILSQKKGLNKGFTDLGKIVLRELLSTQNGKRILIDIKHSSVEARKYLYEVIRNHNYISKNDKIPIIASHMNPNGYKTMSSSMILKDTASKTKNHDFFKWTINISDEEIKIIHESDGLVGIQFDKRRVTGGLFFKHLETLKTEQEKKEAWVKAIWDNIFHMVKVVGEKSAWDMICIGSDFDGAIVHVDGYTTVMQFPDLTKDLYEYLDKYKYEKNHWHGYTAEQLVHKIMSTNMVDFLEKYFV